ncbi:MAG: serpin family protein [Pseudomonadota bacterium]
MGRTTVCTLLFVMVLAACGQGGDDVDTPRTDHAPITELPRALTASERAVVGASNGFGLELAARTTAADTRPNVALSPLSASMVLAMALNGANGTTFDGMRSTLGFDQLSQQQINDTYRNLLDLLTGLDPKVRFEIANAVFTNQGVPFNDSFFQSVTAAFDARVESKNFGDPATVTAINTWVKEHTGGVINGIVDSLDPSLVMLLVNAVYFEAEWTSRFDPANTRRKPFRREDGSTVDVDMMSSGNNQVRWASGATYSAVELPYGGQAFSMVVVLPSPGASARDWLASLDASAWSALIDRLTEQHIDEVSIPKFTLTHDANLNDTLKAMGMDAAFRPGADFTRMSPMGNQMCIDFVRQKTRIEVDERGTRAASVTAAGVGLVSFSSFVADRPFVFAIRERLSGTVLFLGLVEDPTAADPGPAPLVSDCTGSALP